LSAWTGAWLPVPVWALHPVPTTRPHHQQSPSNTLRKFPSNTLRTPPCPPRPPPRLLRCGEILPPQHSLSSPRSRSTRTSWRSTATWCSHQRWAHPRPKQRPEQLEGLKQTWFWRRKGFEILRGWELKILLSRSLQASQDKQEAIYGSDLDILISWYLGSQDIWQISEASLIWRQSVSGQPC